MNASSVWEVDAPALDFPPLTAELAVDVAVIGGGITGITAAMLLAQAGKRVAVLEARGVGMGTTGYSTGNLYAPVDQHLYELAAKWDEKIMAEVARSRSAAVDFVENTVKTHRLPCDFHRRPWHFYALSARPEELEKVDREYQAAMRAGLQAEVVTALPLPYRIEKAVKIDGQAQMNPLHYVRSLAKAIISPACRIFEHSRVEHLDAENGVLMTGQGKVSCQQILMATHTPKGFNLLQTELGPYRECALALRLQDDAYPEGIFWTTGAMKSVRSCTVGGARYLLAIGEKYKVGHAVEDVETRFQALENAVRAHFKVDRVEHRWAAQHYRPADGLPYIGKSIGADNVYLGTGYATDGLTYGTLAAMILSEAILGREHPHAPLYRARRFTPLQSAKTFLQENFDVAGHYLRDFVTRAAVENLAGILPGTGRLVELNGEKLAVYRREDDTLVALSPLCSHLKCIVRWNQTEQSWDCPCHGSRFTAEGKVIEGPAIGPLRQKDIAG